MFFLLFSTIVVHAQETDNSTTETPSQELDLNTEQLEFLQFILDNFEYNDDEERALKDSIESQLYEVREQDLLIAMKIASSHINPLGGN